MYIVVCLDTTGGILFNKENIVDKGGILGYIYTCHSIDTYLEKETGEDNVQRTHQTPGSCYGVRRGTDT